ncbi:hypothetical protein FQZ97_837180 [compost metagenome]
MQEGLPACPAQRHQPFTGVRLGRAGALIEVAEVHVAQPGIERLQATVLQLPLDGHLALRRQRCQRPHHQQAPVVLADRPRQDLVGEEDRVHVVRLFPAIDELRLHAHRLAGDQVLDLAHLVITLVPRDDLFEHRPQLPALPGVKVALQLGLADGGRVLPIDAAHHVGEQPALARALHGRVHEHRRIHLRAQVLQGVRQPARQPLGGRRVFVAQERQQPAQVLARRIVAHWLQGQPLEGIDVDGRVLAHGRVEHNVINIHHAPLRAVQP